MKADIPTNGSMVKNHISSKTGFGYLAIRRTSFLLWFQACQVRPLDLHRLQRHLQDRSHSSSSSSASSSSPTVSEIQIREREDGINSDTSPVPVSTSVDDRSGQPDETQRGNPLDSEIPEWLQEFRKIWWMMKFHCWEALTPVLLMKLL